MSAAVQRLAVGQEAPAVPVLPERPTDITVYEIHHGRIRHRTVRSSMPHGASMSLRYAAAPRLPAADDTLAALVGVAVRCAPWVRVVAGPRLWTLCQPGQDTSAYRRIQRDRSGQLWAEIGGQAWGRPYVPAGSPEVVYCVTWSSTWGALSTLHHELWHVLEYWLAPADMAVITRAVGRGVPLPGPYLDSTIERRARLYDCWAQARDGGWRPVSIMGRPVRPADRVLHYVYSGGLARDVARHGAARPQTGALRRTVLAVARAGVAAGRELVAWPLSLSWPVAAVLTLAAGMSRS